MPYSKYNIFIDGLAGAGKDLLAKNLGDSDCFDGENVQVFNTGDVFRAVAWEAFYHDIAPGSKEYNAFILRALKKTDFFSINRQNLFCEAVNSTVAYIGAVPHVQEVFIEAVPEVIQSAKHDVVLTIGRMLGWRPQYTSKGKIFISTSLETCSHRKATEGDILQPGSYDTIFESTMKRNLKDIEVGVSTMNPAPDAYVIDGEQPVEIVLGQAIDYLRPIWKSYKHII